MSIQNSTFTGPTYTKIIDGKDYKDGDVYSRAFQIGQAIAAYAYYGAANNNIVLAIESAPFGQQDSSSMESMARCRQAIHDAFKIQFNLALKKTYDIAPSTAKKVLTGHGHATKQQMIHAAKVLYPQTMEGHEIYRLFKSGPRKGQKTLDEESIAMADSLAIAKAGMMKWEGEKHAKK
jgi:hypothetical protein